MPTASWASETAADQLLPWGPRNTTPPLTNVPRALLSSLPSPHSQVNPHFYMSQKLDLVCAGISSTFCLPLIVPSLNRKESASLYLQVTPRRRLAGDLRREACLRGPLLSP